MNGFGRFRVLSFCGGACEQERERRIFQKLKRRGRRRRFSGYFIRVSVGFPLFGPKPMGSLQFMSQVWLVTCL